MTYNINAMRPALLKSWENGNKKLINDKFCAELGISSTYFTWYKNTVEKLFAATCEYCRLKNAPKAKADELKERYEKIFPLWKELLATAEKDKFTKELRVREDDVSNLIGFCQMFVNDANDVSRGNDKEFVAHKVWAVQNFSQFRKRVETDLGIRIAQVEVMSDEQRDFLRAEGKVLRKIKKAESRITEFADRKEFYVSEKSKAKSKETKDLLQKLIDELSEKIEVQRNNIKIYEDEYDKLKNPPAEEKAEKVIEVVEIEKK